MNLNENDIIKLSDNNIYLILSKVLYNDFYYFYIVDILNNSNFKIVSIESDNIIEIKDSKTLDEVIKLMIFDLRPN